LPAYNKAARPKRAAPAAPVKAVGKAGATFPLLLAPVAEPDAEAALDAEEMTEDALEMTEPAWLVALLKALPA